LAKALLYHAYTQDDQYNVIGVDAGKLQQVVSLTNDVINSGNYALNSDFAFNYLDGHDNSPESVFAIQYSINDGTVIGGRLSMSTSLNYFCRRSTIWLLRIPYSQPAISKFFRHRC
jgi:hypothetical protein